MEHSEIMELLPAYVDQELGIAETLTVQSHLDSCPECRREYAEQSALSKCVRTETAYFKAPPDLAARIAAHIPDTLPQDKPRRISLPSFPASWGLSSNLSWLQVGTAMATLLVAVWSAGLYLNLPTADDRITEEAISNHVRSLQADHLTDVASTDQHTVKPWFNGKLNFAPTVIDLAPQGFVLEGGRLDYLDGHPVAALIYRRQKHPINLYIWPANGKDAGPKAESSRGYHVVHWTADEMHYWAVSDVEESELLKFSGILRLATHQ
ncbi:anti-sigma factor [Herbaspirillum sp. meg3]|uniref:anti-sigma factor family protein n=1 Tax=Herbaspirillum sp. meg3 TaxID=2025949 RepID=UPI000B992AD1|nr:anti-sigma factor [Herbaspirillum sp. meg3]ASU41557.1 anti-sigma factor [Herbaspirillum sp. meg3]